MPLGYSTGRQLTLACRRAMRLESSLIAHVQRRTVQISVLKTVLPRWSLFLFISFPHCSRLEHREDVDVALACVDTALADDDCSYC